MQILIHDIKEIYFIAIRFFISSYFGVLTYKYLLLLLFFQSFLFTYRQYRTHFGDRPVFVMLIHDTICHVTR